MLSKEASRFDIPFCQRMYVPQVHPTLAYNIKKLEAQFIHGYQPSAPVFYIFITNNHGDERFMKVVDTSNWDLH